MLNRTDDNRILSRDQSKVIIDRTQEFASKEGTTTVRLTSWWNGELRWARNRVEIASDRRHRKVFVYRQFPWGGASATTNQTDATSLRAAVASAERAAEAFRRNLGALPEIPIESPIPPKPAVSIWSEASYLATAKDRAIISRTLREKAITADMLSAGYLEMRAGSIATTKDDELTLATGMQYEVFTQAQCSLTVRHPKGIGSGWAGLSGYDWGAINAEELADRALQKCVASMNPTRIEPGRYTVILEPQATSDLLEPLISSFSRIDAENGRGPFAMGFDQTLSLWRTKLGIRIVDERITISHDPSDPDVGIVPRYGMNPIMWIENGVLRTLEYPRMHYALPQLNLSTAELPRNAFRVSGGATSMDEMISTTQRGLLVTRLSNLITIDHNTLLMTGVTRDGLWLVEDGKTTKSIKNMRFTESPLFILNQIDLLGPSVPVFRPSRDPGKFEQAFGFELTPAIVPPMRTNDFSFTSLSDAI